MHANFSSVMKMFLSVSSVYLLCISVELIFSSNVIKNDNGETWWNHQLYYQLNVKSFKDTDGDGIGDIKGVIYGMDHLISLKINAIILSPIFKMEYDCEYYGIDNFIDIDETLGTLQDFNELLRITKKNGIKVILDLNLDETSTKSQWFQSSINDTTEDLYIWRNNLFPDTRQIWHENREMYYDTIGYPGVEYPMSNYKSGKLIEHIKDVLKYWMERDVSAFRIRVKKEMLEDRNTIESFMILKRYIDVYSKHYGNEKKALFAEFNDDAKTIMDQPIEECFHMAFINSFIKDLNHKSTAKDVKYSIDKMLTYTHSIQSPIWMMKTSHSARLSSYFGIQNSENVIFTAFLLPGSIVMNQGDEIGMFDADVIPQDTCSKFIENKHESQRIKSLNPFQWDDTSNSGFTNNSRASVSDNYRNLNLLKQKRVSKSIYKTYRDLANFRTSAIIKNGDVTLHTVSDRVLIIIRDIDGLEIVLVMINFSSYVQAIDGNIFKQLDDEFVVIVSNDQSKRNMGDKMMKDGIRLDGGEALVLLANEKPCIGPKPVDKIINKLAEAKQKISIFFNID